MTDSEKLIFLIFNEPLKKSDAIILLEGDGYNRIQKIMDLYRQNWSDLIVVSGNIFNPDYGSFPDLPEQIKKMGVASEYLLWEDKSQNTKEQAENIMALAREKNWKKIILVASQYHQLRAYLTFLKAMNKAQLEIQIINAPAGDLPWFSQNDWGRRIDILESEFKRIEIYGEKGDLASFAEAIEYQQWKEECE